MIEWVHVGIAFGLAMALMILSMGRLDLSSLPLIFASGISFWVGVVLTILKVIS